MEKHTTYDLFISHAWQYVEEYNQLVEMLNNKPNFYWRNYSFPEYDTVINPNSKAGKKRLAEELDGQIIHAHAVIILADLYAEENDWLKVEIEIAEKYKKPILVVKSSRKESTAAVLSYAAHELVNWDINSIVLKIKSLVR